MADNDSFVQSINLFVEQAKENMEEVVITTGIKILARLVEMSPVGNPDLWKINSRQVNARQRLDDINSAIRDSEQYGYTDKRGIRRIRRGNKVVATDAVMSSNAGRHGPQRVRKLRRGQTENTAPAGYVGGRFRGNWQVGIDSTPEGETDRIDKNGNATKAMGNLVLSSFRVGMQEIYFVNNVPYAYPLEFGHSSQAPNGMVRITAQEFGRFVDEAARELNR